MMKRSQYYFILGIALLLMCFPVKVFASEVDEKDSNSQKFYELEEGNRKLSLSVKSVQNENKLRSTPSLYDCEIGMVSVGGGLAIECATYSTVYAEEIGCKDIVLQEKSLFGWKDIAIKDRSAINSDFYAGGVVYVDAVKGKTYKVHCTHYAIIDGIEHTLYNITDEMVYN